MWSRKFDEGLEIQAKLELSESSHPWCCIVLKNPCEKKLLCISFLNRVTPCKSNLKLRTLTSTINYGFLWRNKQRMRRRLTNTSHTHEFYKQTFWYNNLVRHLEKYKTRIFDHWRRILRNLSDILTEDFYSKVSFDQTLNWSR